MRHSVQGAYVVWFPYWVLVADIGKETELKTMQFVGELDEEVIENIEAG